MVRKVGLTDSVGFACLEDLQLSNSYMWGTAISLDYCGREDCIKGWKFGPYVRESYVIHMVKKGKGTFTIAGKTYELGPGQAFIIRPGERLLTGLTMMIHGATCGLDFMATELKILLRRWGM